MGSTTRLVIRSIRARGLNLDLARPVETANGIMKTTPLVLLDLLTEEGVVGRSYLRCYTPVALQPLVQLVSNVEELLKGQVASGRGSFAFEARKPVETLGVLVQAIGGQAIGPFPLCPLVELVSVALVLEERNRMAAGVRDALHMNANDGARAWVRRKIPRELGVLGVPGLDHLATPVQANDLGRAVKGAEHDDDAPVFFDMRNRFNATAGQIQVRDHARRKNAKAVQSFRREIEQAVIGARSGGDEEDVLSRKEQREFVVNLVIDLAHERELYRLRRFGRNLRVPRGLAAFRRTPAQAAIRSRVRMRASGR